MKERKNGTRGEKRKKSGRRTSIQSRIILLAILTCIGSLLISSIISGTIATSSSRASTYKLLEDKTASVAAQVSEYMNKAYAVTESLAYSGDIRSLDPDTQHNALATAIQNNPYFILFYQQGTNGEQTAKSSGDLGNRADRWWFKQILSDHHPFITKSYLDINTKSAVTSVIYPVYAAGSVSRMDGVLGADLSLDQLQEIVNGYNTADTYSVILDGEGVVVAHPDNEQVAEMYNYMTGTKTVVSNGQETQETFELSPVLKSLTAEALSGSTGLQEQSGENAIYAYAPISLPGNSGNWAVVTIQNRNAAYASITQMLLSNGILTLILAAAIIAVSVLFSRRLVRPLKKLHRAADQIAQGDLNVDVTVTSRDEIGELAATLNTTVERLKSYINYINEITDVLNKFSHGNLEFELTYDYAGEFSRIKDALIAIQMTMNQTLLHIRQASSEVASGSDQVAGGAQTLSQGATEQASSVEELSAKIQQNAQEADAANAISEETKACMIESNTHMDEMMSAIEDIGNTSGEIGKIIKTIDDIAFQTNILALNAAVEAARAGSAGKGFAVVADEVRNLAGKSAEAAKNTTALIENALAAIKAGTQIANTTAKSMETVVQHTNEVSQKIWNIAQASDEQAASAEQITTGIDQIAAVVQNNSATAEESAAASEELSAQAQTLKTLVDGFKLRDSDEH